jgi:Fic family protein
MSPFLPLLPDASSLGPLLEQASELVRDSLRLESAARGLSASLSPLLREMNSYYSNKIEGQHTRPADIQRALGKQFDADAAEARKQRLAVAHIGAEMALESSLPTRAELYAPAFVQRIHSELYGRLDEADRSSDDGHIIQPGAWRESRVTAGRHLAPESSLIPSLLAEWQNAYSQLPGLEHALVGACCAHHRLLWIHPFLDGNGRTARLHTHLVLTALQVTHHGIWSPLRGMARDREGYYARLNNADLPRRNALDGRGPLSQEELVRFAAWLLDICLDQSRFMRGLLALDQFSERLADLLRWLAAHPWTIGSEMSVAKLEALEALHYVSISGPLERSRFIAMTGLPPRTARRVLATLLDFGLLVADNPRSPVRFAVPLASLRFLFPRLWPEAEESES